MTAFGVSAGFACSMSATVPATTGAAMLVPLSAEVRARCAPADEAVHEHLRLGPVEGAVGARESEIGADAGRNQVGLRGTSRDTVGPRELNAAIESSSAAWSAL